jgi:hypothetical protein
MLFNNEILFLHPVKTAGMSLTNFFLTRLRAPIFYVAQENHHGIYREWDEIICLIGNRHGNLPYAIDYLKKFSGFSIDSFKVVVSVLRNPYSIEISRFYYFAKNIDWIHPDSKEVLLAKNGDFETFAKEAPYNYSKKTGLPGIEHYYEIDGKIPKNVRILRLENIDQDLNNVFTENKIKTDKARSLKRIPKRNVLKSPKAVLMEALSILKLYKPYRLPQINITGKTNSIRDLLTKESEQAIYNKYKWVFDNGYYERFRF